MAIFSNPFFTEMLLPFLLVFVVTFAILQKSKILGEGKSQIDAIVALVIGLILIGVPQPRDIIVGIMPWMAVGVAVILVFIIMYGFVAGDLSKAPKWMKVTFGILAGVFTIAVVLYISGLGRIIMNWFSEAGNGSIWMNVLMVLVLIAVFFIAVYGGDRKKKDSSD